MVKCSLIVAVSENAVIGKAGGLPWHISSDLKYFKAKTMGKPIIMGRKTFFSIGKPLPGRPNIVLTRDAGFTADGVITALSLDMALDVGKSLAEAKGEDEVMIIGGAEIYRLCLPFADRLYLTRVHSTVDGDKYFPDIKMDEWLSGPVERYKAGENDSHDYSIVILDRL